MILRVSIKAFFTLLVGVLAASIVIVAEAQAAKKGRVSLKRLAPQQKPIEPLNKLPEAWSAQESALSATSLQELYTPEMTRGVEGQYKASLAPLEQKAESPYRRASTWEVDRYNKEKEEVAAWTAKEVLSNRLKTIFHRADKTSGAMKAVTAMKELMGGDEGWAQKQPVGSDKNDQKNKSAANKKEAYFVPQKPVEAPAIPTRLKTRVNVVKGQGEVRFTNPIVSTAVNLNASTKADNAVAVRMEKELSALTLKSHVDYGVDKKILSLNLSKKITDEITADISSRHDTSGSELAAGKKSEEAVKMSYSVNF